MSLLYRLAQWLSGLSVTVMVYDAPSLTKITPDNSRCSSNLYSRQLEEVRWTTGCALDNWRYFGQREVFSIAGGTLDN